MQLKASLVLSVLVGLAAAHDGHSDSSSVYSVTGSTSVQTAPQTTALVPTSSAKSNTTLSQTGYASSSILTYSNSTTVTTVSPSKSSGLTSSTLNTVVPPSTTPAASTPTPTNAAARSQFGLAVLGLAVAAGLGL
ncbi:hypothetical protein N656DRAFT_166281 [Canariomyces notabilis]|uniref:Uncharacterized protein n=1 Tax=Canariomyces notabilis TaxID=2074819 RepID=A0AAN6TAM0_9PEZI|nr:hypothetical protein N656DRAFT_166281 [Canariomyces arenarius]